MTSRIPHPYTLIDADLWIASLGNGRVRARRRARRRAHRRRRLHRGRRIERPRSAIWIGKPWWGYGFATEAAQALVDHCFGPAGFVRLTCGHFIDNPASARVIAKLGFRRAGKGRQWCEARKSEVETVRYTRRRPLLAAWWRAAP